MKLNSVLTRLAKQTSLICNYLQIKYTNKLLPFARKHFKPYWDKYLLPVWRDKIIPYWGKELYPRWRDYVEPHMGKVDDQLNEFIKRGAIYFDNWNNTKRVMFLTAGNLVLILAGMIFYILPEQNDLEFNEAKISSVNRSLSSLKHEEKAFLADVTDNPNRSLQDNIDTIDQKIAQQNEKIEAYTKNQLETPRMVQIIKSKVSQNESLKLLRVASLSTYRITPLTLGATKIGLDKLPAIFVHPIELDIDGDYISTYKFLTSLEGSWRIFWDSMEYLVDNYPTAKVSIRVHLLVSLKGFNE